jgi:hypothetical protein
MPRDVRRKTCNSMRKSLRLGCALTGNVAPEHLDECDPTRPARASLRRHQLHPIAVSNAAPERSYPLGEITSRMTVAMTQDMTPSAPHRFAFLFF